MPEDRSTRNGLRPRKTDHDTVSHRSDESGRLQCRNDLHRPDRVDAGGKVRFVFDSTLNDFISGEMEHAVVQCWEEAKPDIIFIEGQSALRNPTGPAGAEWIVSAAADGVVLQHNPARKQYKDFEFYPAYLPDPKDEIALIKMYGAPTVALTLNTAKMTEHDAREYAVKYERELGIPVVLPLEDGVDRIVAVCKNMIAKRKA